MAKSKEDQLEVKIIIPEEILSKEPELKKVYDQKKGELIYSVPETITTEFKEEVSSMMAAINTSEVIIFNPILFGLMNLHEYRDWKPEDNATTDETERRYQLVKKEISSFKTSLTDTKRDMKAPYTEITKKIDLVFNLIDSEIKISKNALETNFKEHLEEKERKKKEAEDKKKAKELEEIKNLQQTNTELLEKQKNQEADRVYLKIQSAIGSLITSITEQAPGLNKSGLQEGLLGTERWGFDNISKNDPSIDISILSEEKINELKDYFAKTVQSCRDVINARISLLDAEEAKQNLAHKNEVLEASIPKLEENDLPMGFQKETPEQIVNSPGEEKQFTEVEKFAFIGEKIKELKEAMGSVVAFTSGVELSNEFTVDIQKKLLEQVFPKMSEWIDSTESWFDARYQRFEEFTKSK